MNSAPETATTGKKAHEEGGMTYSRGTGGFRQQKSWENSRVMSELQPRKNKAGFR